MFGDFWAKSYTICILVNARKFMFGFFFLAKCYTLNKMSVYFSLLFFLFFKAKCNTFCYKSVWLTLSKILHILSEAKYLASVAKWWPYFYFVRHVVVLFISAWNTNWLPISFKKIINKFLTTIIIIKRKKAWKLYTI